jgi:hypothetical protein
VARSRTKVAEEEVVVPKDSNAVAVRARGHEWIAVVQDGTELVREASASSETTFFLPPGRYAVQTDGTIEHAEAAKIAVPADPFGGSRGGLAALRLASDAPDRHVVDGVGEVPADGESSTTITIEKVNAAGEPLHRRRDNDEIFLRSTGGTIADAKSGDRIRSVKLHAGRASFRLVAEPVPRLVTVSALGEGMLAPAELQIEFV